VLAPSPDLFPLGVRPSTQNHDFRYHVCMFSLTDQSWDKLAVL